MNQVQTFEFTPGLGLRAVEIDGEPWFVAKDVCDTLGLDTTKVRRALDSDEVNLAKLAGLPNRGALTVSESGLYALILKSRRPEAKAFRKWVTSEVLPAIRKRGAYFTDAKAREVLADPEAGTTQLLADARAQLAEKDAEIVRLHTVVQDAQWVMMLTSCVSVANPITVDRE